MDFDARGKLISQWRAIVCGALWGERLLEGLGRLVGVEPTTSAATERRSATEL
jgi:hypothetical protein